MPYKHARPPSGWLATVPPEARERIHEIMNRTEKSRVGKEGLSFSWWVHLSPSTGTARNVTLLRKVDGKVVYSEKIMLRGILCE